MNQTVKCEINPNISENVNGLNYLIKIQYGWKQQQHVNLADITLDT